MSQVRRGNRKRDLERIRRLFTADDAEFERLALIARIELETRLYGANRAPAGRGRADTASALDGPSGLLT